MSPSPSRPRRRRPLILVGTTLGAFLAVGMGLVLLIAVIFVPSSSTRSCGGGSTGSTGAITLGPPGTGRRGGISP